MRKRLLLTLKGQAQNLLVTEVDGKAAKFCFTSAVAAGVFSAMFAYVTEWLFFKGHPKTATGFGALVCLTAFGGAILFIFGCLRAIGVGSL